MALLFHWHFKVRIHAADSLQRRGLASDYDQLSLHSIGRLRSFASAAYAAVTRGITVTAA